jgi:hypothetical protein
MSFFELFRYWSDPDAVELELEKHENMLDHLAEKQAMFPNSDQWGKMYDEENKKTIPIRLRHEQLQRRK